MATIPPYDPSSNIPASQWYKTFGPQPVTGLANPVGRVYTPWPQPEPAPGAGVAYNYPTPLTATPTLPPVRTQIVYTPPSGVTQYGGVGTAVPQAGVTPPAAPAGTSQPGPGIVQGGTWGGSVPKAGGTHTVEQLNTYARQGVPGVYVDWFAKAMQMKPTAYYSPARGGSEGAAREYNNFVSYWASRTGRYPTADEVARIMSDFTRWSGGLGRAPTMPDLMDYVTMRTWQAEPMPPIAYLRVGEF